MPPQQVSGEPQRVPPSTSRVSGALTQGRISEIAHLVDDPIGAALATRERAATTIPTTGPAFKESSERAGHTGPPGDPTDEEFVRWRNDLSPEVVRLLLSKKTPLAGLPAAMRPYVERLRQEQQREVESLPTDIRDIATVPEWVTKGILPSVGTLLNRFRNWFAVRDESDEGYERAFDSPEVAGALTRDMRLLAEHVRRAEATSRIGILKDREIELVKTLEAQMRQVDLVRERDDRENQVVELAANLFTDANVRQELDNLANRDPNAPGIGVDEKSRILGARGLRELMTNAMNARPSPELVREMQEQARASQEILQVDAVRARAEQEREDAVKSDLQRRKFEDDFQATNGRLPDDSEVEAQVDQIRLIDIPVAELTAGIERAKTFQIIEAVSNQYINFVNLEQLGELLGGAHQNNINAALVGLRGVSISRIEEELRRTRLELQNEFSEQVGLSPDEGEEEEEQLSLDGLRPFDELVGIYSNFVSSEEAKEAAKEELEVYFKIAKKIRLTEGAEKSLTSRFARLKASLVVNQRTGETEEPINELIAQFRRDKRKFIHDNMASMNQWNYQEFAGNAVRLGIVNVSEDLCKKMLEFYVKEGFESLDDFLHSQRGGEPVLSPAEGMWEWQRTQKADQDRQEADRRRNLWEPTGSGFYNFRATNAEEFRLAAISHIEWLKNQRIDPQGLFQQLEYFRMGLLQWAKINNVAEDDIVPIARAYNVEAYAYLGEKFNRGYDARNRVAVFARMNDQYEGLNHWREATKLREGQVYLVGMNSKDPEFRELLYSASGPFLQYAEHPHTSMALTDRIMREELAKRLLGQKISDVYVYTQYADRGAEVTYGQGSGKSPAKLARERGIAVGKNLSVLGLDQPDWVKRRAYVAETSVLLGRLSNINALMVDLARGGQPVDLEGTIRNAFTPRELEALRVRDIAGRVHKFEELRDLRDRGARVWAKDGDMALEVIRDGSVLKTGNAELDRLLWRVVHRAENDKRVKNYPITIEKGQAVLSKAYAKGYSTEEKRIYDANLKEAMEAVSIFMQIDSMSGDKTRKNGMRYLARARTASGEAFVSVSPKTRETLREIQERLWRDKKKMPTTKEIAAEAGIKNDAINRLSSRATIEQIEAAAGDLLLKAGLRADEAKTVDAIPDMWVEHFSHLAMQKAKQQVAEYNRRIDSQVRAAARNNASERDIDKLLAKKILRNSNEYKFFITFVRDNAIHEVYEHGWKAKLVVFDIDKMNDADFKKGVEGLRVFERDGGLIQRMEFRHGHHHHSQEHMAGLLFESDGKMRALGRKYLLKGGEAHPVYLKDPRTGRTMNLVNASKDPMGRSLETTYLANQWENQMEGTEGDYVPETIELIKEKIIEGRIANPAWGDNPDIAELSRRAESLSEAQLRGLVRSLTPDQLEEAFSADELKVLELRDIRALVKESDSLQPGQKLSAESVIILDHNAFAGSLLSVDDQLGFRNEITQDRNIFEAARRIRDGESTSEEENILATHLLILDPTLERIARFRFADKSMIEELVGAAYEESFLDRLDIRTALSIKFAEMTNFGRPNKDGADGRLMNPAELAGTNTSRWAPRARWVAQRFLALGNGMAEQEGVEMAFDFVKNDVRFHPGFAMSYQELTDGPRAAAIARALEIAMMLNKKYYGALNEGGGDPHDPGGTEKFTRSAEQTLHKESLSKKKTAANIYGGSIIPAINKDGLVDVIIDGKASAVPLAQVSVNGSEVKSWKFKDKGHQASVLSALQKTLDTHRVICETFKLVSDNTTATGLQDWRFEEVALYNPITGITTYINPNRFDPKTGARESKSVGRARHLTARYGHAALDQLEGIWLPMANGRTPLAGARLEYTDEQENWAVLDEIRLVVSDLDEADRKLFPEYAKGEAHEILGPTLREFLIAKWSRR